MSNIVTRTGLVLILIILVVLIRDYHGELAEENTEANPINLFILYIVLAFFIGFIAISYLVPWIGDRLSNLFYAPEEEAEEDPRAPAMALLAQGEYESAVEELQRLAKELSGDRFPIVEIAKIYEEKLHQPDLAIATYEIALSLGNQEWRENDLAFFKFRLADLSVETRQDFTKAKEVLEEVILEFPDTRHSANATHKLRELERAEFAANQKK